MVKMTEFKYLQYYIDEKPLYPMISRDVEIYAFFFLAGGGSLVFAFAFIVVALRLGLMYPSLSLHSLCSLE